MLWLMCLCCVNEWATNEYNDYVKVAEDDIAFKLAILKTIIAFERQYMLL